MPWCAGDVTPLRQWHGGEGGEAPGPLGAAVRARVRVMELRCPSLPARIAAVLALLAVAALTAATPATDHAPLVSATSAMVEPEELVASDVSFRNGDVTVEGTVIAPASQGTDRPGIVLVPGSGEGVPREFYRPHAEAFARAGIVALIYDKRTATEGYSLFKASLTDLADDAIAGVQLLRDRPDVDPDLVGVHGHSEGGWTVAVAGVRSLDVAFVVTSAASALAPERTQVWMNRTQLRHAGVAASLLRPLGENLTRHLVGAGMFRLAGHDPMPPLEQLDQPVLGLFAEYDRSTPPGESLRLFGQALHRGGNTHYTLRVVNRANHLMAPSGDGFDVDLAHARQLHDFAPGYVATVTAWVHGLAGGPPDPSADPPPPQQHQSAPLAPLAASESPGVQLAALALLALAFGAYPLTAAIGRLRSRRNPLPTRWPARALATTGLAIPPLAICYLGLVMITGATAPGPVVAGHPLPWLVLQLAALGAAAATVALIARWWRERRQLTPWTNARFGALVAGTAVFLPWAASWGLFTL